MGSARCLATAFAVLITCSSGAEARDVQRARFYLSTPIGTLAWVARATTREQASTRLIVRDLSSNDCTELPDQNVHWFIINHRDVQRAGTTGYFSVRIIYNPLPGDMASGRPGVHVYRNANWINEEGRQTDEFDRSSIRNTIGASDFVELHDPDEGEEDETLRALVDEIGPWHMRVAPEQHSSWEDRYLYSRGLRPVLRDSGGGISARLLRFTVTSGTSSNSPVAFWLAPHNAAGATILVDAPDIPSSGARTTYRMRFGQGCNEAAPGDSTAATTPRVSGQP